jgi:exodeoxyribonuclease VII large subunit
LAQSQSRLLKNQTRRVDALEAHLRRHDLRVRTGVMRRQLESRAGELNSAILRLLVARRTDLDRLAVALRGAPEIILLRRRSRWDRARSSLEALSPKAILARGYALVFDNDGRLVKQASQLAPGEHVRTQLGRGEFVSQVERVEDESNPK